MKKLLVVLMAICIAFSSLSFTVFAEEATGDAANTETTGNETTESTETETKIVEGKVGAFYLQGESGAMMLPDGSFTSSDYDYQIADVMAKALTGTKRIPFYAYDKEGEVFFDSFAEAYLISEVKAAEAAGIDFFAYDLHMGYASVNSATNLIRNMNMQLIRHASNFGTKNLGDKVEYAIVLDGDFDAGKSMERNLVVDQYLIRKGYLTAEDGRPVVFIKWNEDIQNQITKLNSTLKKAVKDPTNLKEGVESIFAVALNAPSYDEAIKVGAEAISWTEGTGKNGAAYTTMTATVEANWANGSAVIPNVVTGFDKTLLASNPINVEANKQSGKDKTKFVAYSRTGAADDSVAAATAEELVNHVKNAVATTNKPANFKAVMIYAWDDFMGGAYLCPTKTDKQYQYDATYLNALRAYFFGKEDGISQLTVLDDLGQNVITDMREKTITTMGKDSTGQISELTKVDFDGNNLLAPAETEGPEGTESPANSGEPGGSEGGMGTGLIIGIAAGAVVVIGAVIGIIVGVSKKKKSE